METISGSEDAAQALLLRSVQLACQLGERAEAAEPMSGPYTLYGAARNKKLLGAPGIATRCKDATRGSWPPTRRKDATSNKGITTSRKKLLQ